MTGLLRITSQVIAMAVSVFVACGNCSAQNAGLDQNPLRAAKSNEQIPSVPARFENDPNAKPLKQATTIEGLLQPLESATNSLARLSQGSTGQSNASTHVESTNHMPPANADEHILPAGYVEQIEAAPEDLDLQPKATQNRLGLPFELQPLPSDENMFSMAGNIAVNCLFVLSIGIAFILVARRRMTSGSKRGTAAENRDELIVQQVLKIDSKNTLRVIRWRDCDVLVASDSTGIKSVNVMNTSFQNSLEREQTESEELQEIVKKILVKESQDNLG